MQGPWKTVQTSRRVQVLGMLVVAGLLGGEACSAAEVPAQEIDLMLSRLRTMLVGPAAGEYSGEMRQAAKAEGAWVAAALKRQIRDEASEHFGAVDPVYESDRNYPTEGISRLLPPAVRLARAYACRAGSYHRDAGVKKAIELSLRYAMKRAYPGCEKAHNWWCWEMAVPVQIGELMVLMAEDLPDDVRASFLQLLGELNPPRPLEEHWGSYHSANLALSQFRSGLVLRDQRRLQLAMEGMRRACRWPWNRGLQPDYSHHVQAGGTGVGSMDLGYSNDMLGLAGQYVYCTRGTRLALDSHSIEGLTGYVLEFHRWAIWRGWSNPFLFGRGVANEGRENGDFGSVGACLSLAAAGVHRADEMAAFMKRMLRELPLVSRAMKGLYVQFGEPGPVGSLALLDEIRRRPAPAEDPPVGCRFWPWSEYLVYRTPRFFTSVLVSGAAKPTVTWYQINGQGKRAWHGRDGNVVTILDGWDLGPDLFPTLDWERLSGITTEDGTHYESFEISRNPFSGGATLDEKAGIVGMDLRVGSLEARRSYAFFDECMVAQVSRVRSTRQAETVVRQVPLRSIGDPIWVDGRRIEPESGRPTVLKGIRWLHAGRGGYGFPGGADVTVVLEERTGTWRAVNETHPSTNALTRPYLQILFDHGSSPKDAECVSVTWPAADLDSMEERMRRFEREVRTVRTGEVHAVQTPEFRALVFFEPAEAAGCGLDRPGCLMVRRHETSARIAVSEASLRGTEIVMALPFDVDGVRLPEYVAIAGKPNVLRVSLRTDRPFPIDEKRADVGGEWVFRTNTHPAGGLQREFDAEVNR